MHFDVINNGYIRLIETWGSDRAVVEAARMSTYKGFLGWKAESIWKCPQCQHELRTPHNDRHRVVEHMPPVQIMTGEPITTMYLERRPIHRMDYVEGHNGDERLLKYLYEHGHMTPFEMAGCIIEVQAPIFVFREWHRHRTQSYNELSARYTELPDLFYLPNDDRMLMGKQSTTNKQGSEAATFTALERADLMRRMAESCQASRDVYELLIERGLAREIARMVIPVNQISRMRASANLRNWLQFLTLRTAYAAQWEIRQYAKALQKILEVKFPYTMELFANTER